MIPKVTITQLQGQLGVRPPSPKTIAVIGVSSSGTVNQPQAFTRSTALRTTFGVGPLVELASQAIDVDGLTVVACRTTAGAAGAYGAVGDSEVAGTSAITASAITLPVDSYSVRVDVVTGGTIGVAGITYTYSLDGGATNSGVQSLGTATFIEIAGSGVLFDLAAGTLVAGDYWTCATTAPGISAANITASLQALAAATPWDCAIIVGDLTGAILDAIDVEFAAGATAGRYRWWQAGFRVPTSGETDAQYQTAFATALGAKATYWGVIYAGGQRFTSAVSGRDYVRSPLYSTASRVCRLRQHEDPAWPGHGPLPSTQLRDDLGNLLHHDETITPGLDDLRASALRSIEGYTGFYPNNVRVFSAAGSDFEFVQHRRVMNVALAATNVFLIARLSYPTRCDRRTGFILETDRLEIEAGLTQELRRKLLSDPMASDAYAVVAKDNDLLSGDALEVDVRIVPLAYPKEISVTASYINPAVEAAQ